MSLLVWRGCLFAFAFGRQESCVCFEASFDRTRSSQFALRSPSRRFRRVCGRWVGPVVWVRGIALTSEGGGACVLPPGPFPERRLAVDARLAGRGP